VLGFVDRLRQQAEEFQRTVEKDLRTTRALVEELQVRQAKRRGSWKTNGRVSGGRLVKFTYLDLPEGQAFLTAQIAGHGVVYPVILRQAEHSFNREGVERHFLCLLERPFLVRQLMLRPTLDTHLCDDVRAPFAAPDLARIGAFARRAPARGAGVAAPTRPNTGDDMRDRLSRLRRSQQFVRVYGLVSRRPSSLQNL
jgi:hypothetical protein